MNSFEKFNFVAVYDNQDLITEILTRQKKMEILFDKGSKNFVGSYVKFVLNFSKFYLYDPETKFEFFTNQEMLYIILDFLENEADYTPKGFKETVISLKDDESDFEQIRDINIVMEQKDPDREQGELFYKFQIFLL